ncbi:MAG TPA: hypothetical protein VFT55_14275 [Planctomycetota bacterium]|nr:hypothetical protein [Planctomycetota bacterium]
MRRYVVALALVVPACANGVDHAEAVAAFARFQAALQRHDAEGCREVITTESAAALGEMPWDRISKRQPLEVLSATSEQGQFDVRLRVADPNEGGRVSEFVVVREWGRYVVDLVATAGLHTEVVEGTASREQVAPRALTPADIDRIRRYELAQPPR